MKGTRPLYSQLMSIDVLSSLVPTALCASHLTRPSWYFREILFITCAQQTRNNYSMFAMRANGIDVWQLTISVVKSPMTNSSLMYHRYVTSGGFASAWHLYLTSEPSAMRPSLIVPPMADTLTFGAYFTYINREREKRHAPEIVKNNDRTLRQQQNLSIKNEDGHDESAQMWKWQTKSCRMFGDSTQAYLQFQFGRAVRSISCILRLTRERRIVMMLFRCQLQNRFRCNSTRIR